MPAAWELRGRLDASALRGAFRLVTQRHDVLGGGYFAIAEIELLGLGAHEQAAEIARATRALPADRLRASCLRCGPERHVFVLAADALVADEPSLTLLGSELASAYEALVLGDPPRLKREGQFRKFRVPDKCRVPGATTRRSGEAPIPGTCARGTGCTRRLGGEATATQVLAALIAVWARYTGQDCVAVAVADDGRPAGFEHCVGAFERDLVLHVDLSGLPPFDEIERRAAAARSEIKLGRTQPRVRFDDRPARLAPLTKQLSWRPLALDPPPGRFDLVVRFRAPNLIAASHRVGGPYDSTSVSGLLGHVATLLAAGLQAPDRRLSDLPLLTEPERRRIILDLNRTGRPEPPACCLHELVELQARATPDTMAIVADDDRLSYRELNERANRLAHRLRSLGVKADDIVAVTAVRQARTITAFLGVLKAGAAYVPIEPDTPAERLSYMLAGTRAHTVLMDGDYDAPNETFRASDPISVTHPDNLAYLIYTSGTSGQPKAVAVAHRQIVHSTAARWADGRASPGAYAVPVPLSFDASAAGIWWSLCTGGRVVLPADDDVRDPVRLARLIRLEQVTHMTHMPAYYALLLSAGGHALRTLRDVAIGGDVMPAALVRDHCEMLPWATLYNDYGPTEATIWATAFRCDPARVRGTATVPIGQPIAGARVYVLDRDGNPVPEGVSGEIHIGGRGVARGYHGEPRLTAERFVPDPFAESPGSRMYRSGDLGRLLPSGHIEFLGRTDTQVKIRGHRVEIGDIEAVLSRHPSLSAAVVTASEDRSGEIELTAFITAAREAPSRDRLIRWLRARLPAYMIPTHIVELQCLPQTPSGKTDRSALARGEYM